MENHMVLIGIITIEVQGNMDGGFSQITLGKKNHKGESLWMRKHLNW